MKRFKASLVTFFGVDFNLLSCDLDNYTFEVLYSVVFYWLYEKKTKL